jgi:glycosyltransferase involved in cell wall biosynthesis/GT2 family glycosyltransferase
VRIAFVVHGYPPEEAAGVELVASEQAEALARRGHAVSVFARSYRGSDVRVADVGGIEVWRAPLPAGAGARFEDAWDNRFFDEPFTRFLDTVRPELLHAQHLVMLSPNLLELARARGMPVVLSLHDAFYLCHRLFLLDHVGRRCSGPDAGARCEPCLTDLGGRDVARARFEFMARRLAGVDAVLAPSRALIDRYVGELPFLADRIELLDPGVPAAGPLRERGYGLGRAGAPLRFLFIGTWLPHKGLDLLVTALGRFDPTRWRLTIHGGGVPGGERYVEALEEAARDLPVAWAGAFPPAQIDEVLAGHDVLVLPSRCDESYSRVVREARSAGLAVVAPASGGPAEALRDDLDGLLVAPGSAAELERALQRLLDDPALVRRLGAPDRRWGTVGDAAVRLEQVYARLCGAVPAPGTCCDEVSGGRDGRPLTSRPRVRRPGRRPSVSVVYVTKNGAELLDDSLAAVRRQRGDFDLAEIVAVDSGSRDATLDILARHGARVIEIDPTEFGHGRTRNHAARATHGDIVAFLTQDASPACDDWLARLVEPLAEDPLLAGVWSRHLPRPGCHPMEWRRVVEFPLFRPSGLVVSSLRGGEDPGRPPELVAWFSNNASAIPRAILDRWPFPEVDFAEDQAWARMVLDAGFRVALANDSLIFHSHAYSPWTNLRRNFDHACAMRETLGRRDDLTAVECLRAAVRETRRDIAFWAADRGRPRTRVAVRWGLPAAAYHLGAFGGRWLGARANDLPGPIRRRLSLRERQHSSR